MEFLCISHDPGAAGAQSQQYPNPRMILEPPEHNDFYIFSNGFLARWEVGGRWMAPPETPEAQKSQRFCCHLQEFHNFLNYD